MTFAAVQLEPIDWAVLGGYLVLLFGVGVAASGRTGTADYFLGGRRMPVWAVALSVLATATSAATFIGGPEESYVGDLTYLSTNIGTALAVVVVAFVFIPAFYRANVTTVYDLLERRFGRGARTAASWTFMIGRVFASGARIFVAALPVSLVLFGGNTEEWHMVLAIVVISLAGILTAMGGGIRSVIYTDVLQVGVFVLAAAAAVAILLDRVPLDPVQIFQVLRDTPVGDHSKLTVLSAGVNPRAPGWGFDPAKTYTVLTAVLGFSLLNLAAYGTDHDLTQRMLTCRNALRGGSSAFLAMALNIPMVALFMCIGLLLHIFYQRPDLMGSSAPAFVPAESKNVFLQFILHEMPPGLTGLMMAGLFAVGIGSLNSALGAMSAAFVNDVYRPFRPGREDRHYLRVGRAAVVAWGVVLALFGCWCIRWHNPDGETLIQFVLGVMTFAYAGLLGVFLTALLTPRGSTASVVCAIVAGFLAVLLMQPASWVWWTGLMSWTAATPDDPLDWRLGELRLAFPWRLTVAVAIAFGVCCIGRGRRAVGAAEPNPEVARA